MLRNCSVLTLNQNFIVTNCREGLLRELESLKAIVFGNIPLLDRLGDSEGTHCEILKLLGIDADIVGDEDVWILSFALTSTSLLRLP